MKKTRKRNSFTLLEVLIALVILSVIGALTAVHVKKLIDAHRFESEISQFFTTLQDAQVLSATYRTDIALDITRKGNAVSYRFTTAEPFSPHQLDQQSISLPQTTLFTFNQTKPTALHIDIYAGGRIEPRGILAFATDSKTLWIDVQRGHLLKFLSSKPALAKQSLPAKPKELLCN